MVVRDTIHEAIDSIHEAVDEANKAASVNRIVRVLGAIDPKILEAEVITDLEDLRDAIADYRGITREGLTPEEYQDEKGNAFEAIREAADGLDIDEDALESLEAPPVKTRREQIMDFDRDHTLDEVKRMAKGKGISPSGTKHEIIARLLEKSLERLPKVREGGEPVPAEYRDLVSLISKPLPREAY